MTMSKARAPWSSADQLTLLEPGWADFAPHTTILAAPHWQPPTRIQKAIYTSVDFSGGVV